MEYLLKPLRLGDQPAPTIVLHKDSRRQLIPQEKFELYVKTIHEQHGHEKAKKLTERMRRDYHLTEVEKRKITQIISDCKVCSTAVDLVNQEERYELRPQQATEVNQVWVCDFAVYEQVKALSSRLIGATARRSIGVSTCVVMMNRQFRSSQRTIE